MTGGIPLVAHAAQDPGSRELEDLHDLLTFDAMVDEQVARSKPTNAELLYERLHKRWPDSRRITKRLARAHERAISGGPINATPDPADCLRWGHRRGGHGRDQAC